MNKGVLNNYLIAEAAKLSGLSTYMLDYLCREEVLVPSAPGRRGRGCPRKYSFGDVVMLRAVSRLLSVGVSVQRIRKALRALRRHHNQISPTSLPAKYLVTDGTRVYLQNGDTLLELDGSGQMSFFFVFRNWRTSNSRFLPSKREDAPVATSDRTRAVAPSDAGSARNTLFELQVEQHHHDENYHREIARLSLHQRLNHMALHFAKYAGKVAATTDPDGLTRVYVDVLIIALSTANILNIKLWDLLEPDGREFPGLLAFGRAQAIRADGRDR